MLSADGVLKIRHLHRRQRRFETFISHFQTSAVNGLFEGLAGQDAKRVRDAGFLRRLSYAARDFVDDDIVVGSVSAKQAAKTDNRVVFFGFSEGASGGGNFERAGHANDGDVLLCRTATKKAIIRATQQALGDEFVETGDDDGEAKAGGVEFAANGFLPNLAFGGLLCGFASLC